MSTDVLTTIIIGFSIYQISLTFVYFFIVFNDQKIPLIVHSDIRDFDFLQHLGIIVYGFIFPSVLFLWHFPKSILRFFKWVSTSM
jgi:hypothetical protein